MSIYCGDSDCVYNKKGYEQNYCNYVAKEMPQALIIDENGKCVSKEVEDG